MKRNKMSVLTCTAIVCFMATFMHAISNGEKVNLSGLITGRDGDTLTVRTLESNNVVVALTDQTNVVQPQGVFKLRKKQMGMTALMPGLKVSVEGVGDAQNRVVAKTIKFSKDDLKTAQAIEAGLVPTQQAVQTNAENIAANKQDIATNRDNIAANQQDIQDVNKRFSELSDYDVKYTETVYFGSGSSAIQAKDKAALKKLSNDAVNLTGYIVQVKGYADSSGNAAMNQKLSMDRAQEVIAFLLQECNVPLRHIVAPGAMGETDPKAANETSEGRSENRRVEVKVLVNRGLAARN